VKVINAPRGAGARTPPGLAVLSRVHHVCFPSRRHYAGAGRLIPGAASAAIPVSVRFYGHPPVESPKAEKGPERGRLSVPRWR
jgi:hypothetical protein